MFRYLFFTPKYWFFFSLGFSPFVYLCEERKKTAENLENFGFCWKIYVETICVKMIKRNFWNLVGRSIYWIYGKCWELCMWTMEKWRLIRYSLRKHARIDYKVTTSINGQFNINWIVKIKKIKRRKTMVSNSIKFHWLSIFPFISISISSSSVIFLIHFFISFLFHSLTRALSLPPNITNWRIYRSIRRCISHYVFWFV